MPMLKSEHLGLYRMSHSACHMSHCARHMSNAYVDSWDMLNNFRFDVYAQKWIFVIMSHVLCQMLRLILGTCWTSFVFMCRLKNAWLSCCHDVICPMLVLGTCLATFVFTSRLKTQVFLCENAGPATTLSCEFRVHRADSQLKMIYQSRHENKSC